MKKLCIALLTFSSCCTEKGYVESFDSTELVLNRGGDYISIPNPTYKDSVYVGRFVKIFGTSVYAGKRKDLAW